MSSADHLFTATPEHIEGLGPITAALTLWALPDDHRLAHTRTQLIRRVQADLSVERIRSAPIEAVFTAIAALSAHPHVQLGGDVLAQAVQRLLSAEAAPGGPYKSAAEVTPGINALVSCFTKAVTKPLPHVERYVHTIALNGALHDPMLSPQALTFILRQAGHEPLATTTNDTLPLAKNEQPSPLAAAALAAHEQHARTTQREGYLHDAIIQQARELFAGYGSKVAHPATTLLNAIQRADTTHEIALMPHLFATSLAKPTHLSEADVRELCVANVCGWLAYTVYDHFLDDRGNPEHLPIANIAARLSVQLFQKIAPQPEMVQQLFATMDRANAWELARARQAVRGTSLTITTLPKYKKGAHLAERSIAHALGPLIVLAGAGARFHTLQTAEAAFRHFLIARQLADDLYDWQEDIRSGHASYVVTAILRDMRVVPGIYKIDALVDDMQDVFATRTRARVCEQMLQHTARAHELVADLLTPDCAFFVLVDSLARVAQKSLTAHAQNKAFLQAFAHGWPGTPHMRGAR